MNRLPIPQYVMALAHVAALRSEDPYRKVGAAALDKDNRVIGTAYNGLFPGFKAPEGFWASRDERQKYMLHAEINLCSLFKRGEAKIVACTTMPCTSCMQALCAHGVKTIYYGEDYAASQAPAIAEMYGVELIKVDDYPLSHRFPLVQAQPPAPGCSCGGEHQNQEDRAKGCLMGLMCGDALGAPLEFHSPEEVNTRFPGGITGMVDGWDTTCHRLKGQITDDSEMAIALLRSLLNEQGFNRMATHAQYIDWLSTNPADVGVTTRFSLNGEFNADSQANGALMRVAPMGIYAVLHPQWDWQTATREDCAITHIHPRCANANIIFVESLMLAMQGESPHEIHAAACQRAEKLNDVSLLSRLRAAETEEPQYHPQAGWVEIAFQCAYYWLLHARDFASAMCSIVGRLGDPDTNGAIAGALLGARFGINAIPYEWQQTVLTAHHKVSRFRACRGMEMLEELIEQAR